MKIARYSVFERSRDTDPFRLVDLDIGAQDPILIFDHPALLADLVHGFARRRFAIELEPGDSVVFLGLGAVRISAVEGWRVTTSDFLTELRDARAYLRGEPTSLDRCLAAFLATVTTPSESHRERLQQTLDAVPRHLRQFMLGHMDRRHGPMLELIEAKDLAAHAALIRADPDFSNIFKPGSKFNANGPFEAHILGV